MWSFDIFKNWGFPEQDKFKQGIGYTQSGGAASPMGEAASFDSYGKETTSGIIQQKRQKKGHIKGVMETVNMVPSPHGTVPNNQQTLGKKSDGTNLSLGNKEDPKWWEELARKAGVNPDKAAAQWKDKGGFEGLMANPAFTMGLAFMQAGAEGKTLGAGSLDNVMKAAGISSHYKKIIEDRKQKPITVTSADVSDVKDLMATLKVEEPNWWEKVGGFLTKGDTGQAGFDQAAEQIASAVQVKIEAMQRSHKGKKPFVIDIELKKKVIKEVLASGKIKHKKAWTPWTSGTVKSTSENPFGGNKARGGPITQGKSYVVGEQGPEIVIPKESAQVLSNDNSKIYAMLLAANPQLQKVSRARSEKILRNRFPEYFE